jgi:hypothetical protein
MDEKRKSKITIQRLLDLIDKCEHKLAPPPIRRIG